jgi:hypothetical protein
MDRETIKKKLTSSKTKDYTYGIIFLVTFSFFLFFVIRPNLVNVFSLQEELGRLKILDTGYENVIRKIVNIQTFLETNRSDLYLLDQGITSTPQINQIVRDIETAASSSGITVTQVDIGEVDLREKDSRTAKNILHVNLSTKADFALAKKFITHLLMQRRLKTLKHVGISKSDTTSSTSALLDISLELEGYYL